MASRSMLEISRELASISQAGITYSKDPFDKERFQRLREIASEVLHHSGRADFQWPVEIGYLTPKVDVRGAVFRGDVLLTGEFPLEMDAGRMGDEPDARENIEKECPRRAVR
jgi:hypothetical protein